MKPIIIEQYSDNGQFSHWHLIDESTGSVLWSSFPEETLAKGQRIIETISPKNSCRQCNKRKRSENSYWCMVCRMSSE